MTEHHDRHVAIVFYGFDSDPERIAGDVGYEDVAIVKIGDVVGRRFSRKNRITWRYPIYNDQRWDFGFDALIDQLGGPERFEAVINRVKPDAAWFRVCVPSIGSPWQESGGLGKESIHHLSNLNLDFDVAIFEYDASNPTHDARPAN